jgi:hypothetical protein
MDACIKHPHEMGVAPCRRCGGSWCASCLVYSFGTSKPPFCLSCAMVAGGVRTSGARPPVGKRELKALQKATKVAAKAAAKQAKREPEAEPVAAAIDVGLPPASSGWDNPWWEDRQPTLAD